MLLSFIYTQTTKHSELRFSALLTGEGAELELARV